MTKRREAARAVADLDGGTILACVDIAAPIERERTLPRSAAEGRRGSIERVWRALTTDELARWWGSDQTYKTTSHAIDLRVGGAWRSEGMGATDGKPFHVGGEVLEVSAPHKLVCTWQPSWETGAPTTVAYLLDALPDGGTRVTVRHTGFAGQAESLANHAQGWEMVLGWLGGFAAPAASPLYFFVRLIPPRATFAADMSADERAVMMKHVAYWSGKLAEGGAIAFGPVADPAGGWGLGLVAARDEAELRAFQSADPALTLGMHYETLPMPRLVF